jgi:Mn2+/Fe2+ NRAMP family transporter
MTDTKNSQELQGVQKDRQLIVDAKAKGPVATLGAFVKLSGPGWLQSAITLGGGSLAGSLYLGVLAGVSLLWLQPLAMIMGVIMLSAISYVTLSTGERPFQAINKHVNPVLGWGWAIATLMANLVWALPQFSLGTAAIRQNLLPSIFGTGPGGMTDTTDKLIVCAIILTICITVVWFYDTGRKGIKLFEILLKIMVGIIVLSFFGVVVKMSLAGSVKWDQIFGGLIPDLNMLTQPAKTLTPHINAVNEQFREFWTGLIVSQQRDVMVTAAATAVGINMTFLLPYSMLKRGWGKDFRGLAIFDLSTGLFIPFILATGCVVIASATQFHAQPAMGFLGEIDDSGRLVQPDKNLAGKYQGIASERIAHEIGAETFATLTDEQKAEKIESLPLADKRMCAMLVKRDSFDLAQSLSPLTGDVFAHYLFGIGVVGMAISSIIILMLINGFVVCEMLGRESTGWPYRIGCLLPAVGALGPFFWTKAAFWLAVPTSVFGMTLLPVAYFTFFFVMNQKSLLGDNMPRGGRRVLWNVLMLIAAGLAAFGSIWSITSNWGGLGIIVVIAFIALAVIVHFIRKGKTAQVKN